MDIIKRIKGILFEPSKFFDYLVKEKNKKEKGFGNAFLFYVIMSLFVAVLAAIVGIWFQPFQMSMISKILGISFPIMTTPIWMISLFTILGYGIGLLMSFVGAAILHVWILIFGGKENYTETYKLYVYSRTPSYVFAWIPFIGFFIWIWSLVLLIKGTQTMHKISRLRAILMYAIPIVVIIILGLILLIIGLMLFKQAIAGGLIPTTIQ